METKDKGWVKLERDIISEEWLWKPEERFDELRAWLYILMNVNYKTKIQAHGDECIKLEPGTLVTSISKLAERWRWNRRTVSRFLKLLSSREKIKLSSFGKFLLITIISENDENMHTPKTAYECGEEPFFKTFDAQENTQESAQEDAQESAQESTQETAHNNKERNKYNNVLEGEKERKEEEPVRPAKKNYADNILLTEDEYKSLADEYGVADTESAIGIVSEYKKRTSKSYESDYQALRKWGFSALFERRNPSLSPQKQKHQEFDLLKDDTTEDEFERLMWQKLSFG